MNFASGVGMTRQASKSKHSEDKMVRGQLLLLAFFALALTVVAADDGVASDEHHHHDHDHDHHDHDDDADKELPEDAEKLEYHKGSLCGYCDYCKVRCRPVSSLSIIRYRSFEGFLMKDNVTCFSLNRKRDKLTVANFSAVNRGEVIMVTGWLTRRLSSLRLGCKLVN